MSNLKEIAKRTGVAVSTVSLVLNGRSSAVRISEATRSRVLETARQIGYTPNVAARRLRAGGTARAEPVLALLAPIDARFSLISRVVTGVRDYLSRATVAAGYESEAEPELLIETYLPGQLGRHRSLLSNHRAHGVIVVNSTPEDDAFLEANDLAVPIVLFQRRSRHSYVQVDNAGSGRAVASHLLDSGYQHFAVLVPSMPSAAFNERRDGFLAALTEAGVDPAHVSMASGNFSEEGGAAAMEEILARRAVRLPQPPLGVFALTDAMAIGAMYGARVAGLRVPEDVGFVGHDDLEVSAYVEPPLSSVHTPRAEMAGRAAGILLDLLQRRVEPPIQEVFPSHLVVRASSERMAARTRPHPELPDPA